MPEPIPLDQIVPNRWRDFKLDPLDDKHVADLVASIKEHGFTTALKGRHRDDGKVEICFGHARVAAAHKAGFDSVLVEIDDSMDDNQMLLALSDENALQSGGRASAAMNEVAAVLRLLIKGLLEGGEGQSVPDPIKYAFEDRHAIATALGKIRKRMADPDADVPISYNPILRYFGQGNEKATRRGERQIRDAISVLKQSGRYDEIIDEAARKYAPAVAPSDTSTAAVKPKQPTKRSRRILDERCAGVFPKEHQFHTFREAVTAWNARKVIPVEQQYALAKQIMEQQAWGKNNKQIPAPYIKAMVQAKVAEGMKQQRKINKEERDAYFREQFEAEIDDKVQKTTAAMRAFMVSVFELQHLVEKDPILRVHPKLGGLSHRLDSLVSSIQQLSKMLK